MFVVSVKSSTVKLFAIAFALVICISAALIFLPDTQSVSAGAIFEGNEKINYDKIETNEARIDFLKQFGWEVSSNPIEEEEIKIPSDFDKIMNAYNELQKSQGLDLSKFKGKTAVRYTYEITNYENYTGSVLANVIVYKNRVIGGDICSSDVSGFIHGFEKVSSAE